MQEGNFRRACADHFIDLMNEKAGFNSKVVLVQPRGGHPEAADRFAEQDGLYTLILRGRENGQPVERKRVISAASRCLDPKRDWEKLLDCARNPVLRFVISNTTEAGIAFDPACKADDAPPSAFPAKLTIFLRERWKLGLPGVIILSCELIDHNGQELRRCVNEYVKLGSSPVRRRPMRPVSGRSWVMRISSSTPERFLPRGSSKDPSRSGMNSPLNRQGSLSRWWTM